MTREKKRSSGSSLAGDFYEYCRERTLYIVLLAAVFLAVYGVWTTQDIMTFDAEGFYVEDLVGGWLKGWIGVGRWGFFLLKKVLRVVIINPYFSMAVFLVAFPLSSVVWSFFIFRAQGNRADTKADVLIFGLVYLTHPIWTYQYVFRNQIEVFSIALVILAFAMAFFRGVDGNRADSSHGLFFCCDNICLRMLSGAHTPVWGGSHCLFFSAPVLE